MIVSERIILFIFHNIMGLFPDITWTYRKDSAAVTSTHISELQTNK